MTTQQRRAARRAVNRIRQDLGFSVNWREFHIDAYEDGATCLVFADLHKRRACADKAVR